MPEQEEEEEEEYSEKTTEKDSSTETMAMDETVNCSDNKTVSTVAQETTASGEVTVEKSVPNALKPDLSEIRKENNRDTMSYLKAKRINRHKNNDTSDTKKFKLSD